MGRPREVVAAEYMVAADRADAARRRAASEVQEMIMSAQLYEVVTPINDDLLVEAVAVAIFHAHPEYDLLRWSDSGERYRDQKRTEARAAITVMLRYFIQLEGVGVHE